MLPEPSEELAVGAPATGPRPGPGSPWPGGAASAQLLADLRADKGMGWLPADGMWLGYLRIDSTAGQLTHGRGRRRPGQPLPGGARAGVASVAGADPARGRPGPAAGTGLPGWWPWPAAALVVTAGRAGPNRKGRSALR